MIEDREIYNRVKKVLKSLDEDISEKNISLEANLRKDLGLDMFDQYELAVKIEEEFGINISDKKVHEFETVRDYFNYLIYSQSTSW
jgi:acyl carrier protein